MHKGAEKDFLTAQIFEKSCCLLKDENEKYLSKKPMPKSEKYLYRHGFKFETSDCIKPVDYDDPKLQQFLKVDKYKELMKIKEEVVEELFYNFISQDSKIINVMTDVIKISFLNMDEKLEKIEKGQEVIKRNTNQVLANQKLILEKIQQMELKPQNDTVTIAFGNPGSGKSTLLNSLAGELFFKSGISLGRGITSYLGVGKNYRGVFLDTPGLADESLRNNSSQAICEGMRRDATYLILFFVTERNGRVLVQDTTTIRLVLEACPDIGTRYGIIVNMVSKKFLKNLKQNFHEFLNTLFNGIPEDRRCSYEKVLFLGKNSELEDEDDVLISSDDLKSFDGVTLTNFVNNIVPTVSIKKENVSDVRDEDFDKINSEIEAMSRNIAEKDEAWKEERRLYEEERMKEGKENQRKLKKIREKIQTDEEEIESFR